MIVKNTYSNGGVWRPDIDGGASGRKLAGPCEVSFLKLIGSGAAATVAIYDSNDGSQLMNPKWYLDASTAYDDTNPFPNPLAFRRGVWAVLEQGTGTNSIVCIATTGGEV